MADLKSEQDSVQDKKMLSSLQSDIKEFVESLPEWGKVLAVAILVGKSINEEEIDNAYQILLEILKILPAIPRENVSIDFNNVNDSHFDQLIFREVKDTVGINALAEMQVIKLGDNLTIIYGANGAGKSGYVRLFKRVFYTKSREDILPNIYLAHGGKNPAASFLFDTGNGTLELKYPTDVNNPAFSQFSVFDGKSVLSHLDQRNALEFRPSGLSFFSSYTEAIKKLELKLQESIKLKQIHNPFLDLFEGDSEIKVIISNLSSSTDIADLNKYLPFTEEDQSKKKNAEVQYDEILLSVKGKDREIAQLELIIKALQRLKLSIENLNRFFSEESLKKVHKFITWCVEKEQQAREEGTQSFSNLVATEVGSSEWKSFITAASVFAQTVRENDGYPLEDDSCLFCSQPLNEKARELILKYWDFIKSEAEKRAAEAIIQVNNTKVAFEKLSFDLFPEGNILTLWMVDKKTVELNALSNSLKEMEALRNHVVLDLNTKSISDRAARQIDVSYIDIIIKSVEGMISGIRNDAQQRELLRLQQLKTFYHHKEKLHQRKKEIEFFINDQLWIAKASKVNWGKRGITEAEKELSGKYFNQKYVDTFNEECKLLDGNFNVEVNYSGSGGSSYRQLSLKGKSPSSILSEGEQKVIALADFIAEMRMSEINRGMIFDDPVNSLDEHRKKRIAEHLAKLSTQRQIIVFSHDLVFVSSLITCCQDINTPFSSHWVEKRENIPGMLFLDNSPSYEKEYRNSAIPINHYNQAKRDDCQPAQREYLIKAGFTALRTCYEVLVINDLFNNVVQRFNERVSIDSLSKVNFDKAIVDELMDRFARCCRYMEGHTHSDRYAYKKPELKDLKDEIDLFDALKKKIKTAKKLDAANA